MWPIFCVVWRKTRLENYDYKRFSTCLLVFRTANCSHFKLHSTCMRTRRSNLFDKSKKRSFRPQPPSQPRRRRRRAPQRQARRRQTRSQIQRPGRGERNARAREHLQFANLPTLAAQRRPTTRNKWRQQPRAQPPAPRQATALQRPTRQTSKQSNIFNIHTTNKNTAETPPKASSSKTRFPSVSDAFCAARKRSSIICNS